LQLVQDERLALVSRPGFLATFDKSRAALTSLQIDGIELIESPLRPDFWRAPTDNERGRRMAVNHLAESNARPDGKEGRKPQGIWRQAHQDAVIEAFNITQPAEDRVVVVARHVLPTVQARWQTTYTVFSSGDITVEAQFDPQLKELPYLPRLGLQMVMPSGFDRIEWFGPGPHETYCDRRDAKVGRYSGSVREQLYPHYVEPGESGNKVDVRWVALTNRRGEGLLAVGAPFLSVNALHHTTDDLQNAKHPHELPARDFTVLNLDLISQGVGGDDSWGAWPHEPYLIPCEPRTFSFRLRPLTGKGDPAALARSPVRP
jgi:beta-galactosidase